VDGIRAQAGPGAANRPRWADTAFPDGAGRDGGGAKGVAGEEGVNAMDELTQAAALLRSAGEDFRYMASRTTAEAAGGLCHRASIYEKAAADLEHRRDGPEAADVVDCVDSLPLRARRPSRGEEAGVRRAMDGGEAGKVDQISCEADGFHMSIEDGAPPVSVGRASWKLSARVESVTLVGACATLVECVGWDLMDDEERLALAKELALVAAGLRGK
jgi:hypothetical protein